MKREVEDKKEIFRKVPWIERGEGSRKSLLEPNRFIYVLIGFDTDTLKD